MVKSIDYAYTDEQGPTTLITLLNVKTYLGNAPKELMFQAASPLPKKSTTEVLGRSVDAARSRTSR